MKRILLIGLLVLYGCSKEKVSIPEPVEIEKMKCVSIYGEEGIYMRRWYNVEKVIVDKLFEKTEITLTNGKVVIKGRIIIVEEE